MPNVNGREFGYSKANIKKAKAYANKTGKKVTKRKSKNKLVG